MNPLFSEQPKNFKIAARYNNNDAYAHFLLAKALFQQGFILEAGSSVECAITLDGDLPEAWCLLGLIARNRGDIDTAVQSQLMAIETDIDNPSYWQQLSVLTEMSVKLPIPTVARLVTTALHRRTVKSSILHPFIYPLLVYSNNFKSLRSIQESHQFDKIFESLDSTMLLDDELLYAILLNTRLHYAGIELLLTGIRKALLKAIIRGSLPLQASYDRLIKFTSALACYLLTTEFVFYVSDEEMNLLRQCKDKFKEIDHDEKIPNDYSVYHRLLRAVI